MDDGSGPVGIYSPLELSGDGIQRLVPGYPFEPSATPWANAFDRVFQPVGMVYSLPPRASSHACPELNVILIIVGFDPGYDAIFYMSFKQTATPTMWGASSGYHSLILDHFYLPL